MAHLKHGRVTLGLAAMLVAPLFALPVHAMPPPGATVPTFPARDITGAAHSSAEWRGHSTLVVLMTDRSDQAQRETANWLEQMKGPTARAHARLASVVSLHLPAFAVDNLVRARARARVQPVYWHNTWLDRDGEMAQALGASESSDPYVMVVDRTGKVRAAVHAAPTSATVTSIRRALESR